jgi:hypothetical protein
VSRSRAWQAPWRVRAPFDCPTREGEDRPPGQVRSKSNGSSVAAFGDTSLHFIEITGCDDNSLTFLQLPAGLLDVRAAFRACCISEHGAGIVINWNSKSVWVNAFMV